jgi:hypothetical protein
LRCFHEGWVLPAEAERDLFFAAGAFFVTHAEADLRE